MLPLRRRHDGQLTSFIKQSLDSENARFRIERIAQSVALPGGFVHNRLPYQDIVENVGNWVWSGSPTYQLTVPKTGLYLVAGAYSLESTTHTINSITEYNIGVTRTGPGTSFQYAVLAALPFQTTTSFGARIQAARLLPFQAGDIVIPNQRASNAESTPAAANSADRRGNYFEMTLVLELETVPSFGF